MGEVVIAIEHRDILTTCCGNGTAVVLAPAYILRGGYDAYRLGVLHSIILGNGTCAVRAAILANDNLDAKVGLLT